MLTAKGYSFGKSCNCTLSTVCLSSTTSRDWNKYSEEVSCLLSQGSPVLWCEYSSDTDAATGRHNRAGREDLA